MARRFCSHGFDVNRCTRSTTCPNYDSRPLVQQLFGRGDSNSQLAAKVARESPDHYKQLADQARALGLLPTVKIPRCPQDHPD